MSAAKAPKLVIVESPAKAKTIGKFLGKGYKVEASNGHVRDLPKSQIGIDIEHGFEPRYITIRGRGEILDRIKKDAKSASKVLVATDPDREGEAIAWHLMHILNIDEKKNCRIEFNEITKKAVQEAVKKPRAIDKNLVDAQQARRVLDRLVGYKISPLLWAKIKKGLSAGRVQSVAMRIICDREDEIRAFVPEEFWTLDVKLTTGAPRGEFMAKYILDDNGRIKDPELVHKVKADIEKKPFIVTDIKEGERRQNPAAPYTTSQLQQDAARKLGFTTKKTMMLAQQLYEGVDIKGEGTVGLITYIRTDSTRLSQEAQTAAREYIAQHFGAEYLPDKPNQFKGKKGAQDAHEAIRATSVAYTPERLKESLTREQYRLYKMIYNRFLGSQMKPAVYATMQVSLTAGEHLFRANGSRLIFKGFLAAVGVEKNEHDTTLPGLEVGQRVKLVEAEEEQHFTQPPPRYNEASLVRTLEEKGIGRPSTYAPTISTILDRGYVIREQRTLFPTELGEIVTKLMKNYFSDIVDVEFTADMEDRLDAVEEGDQDWKKIVSDFYGPFAKTLEKAEEAIEKVEVKDEVSDVQCEKCGAMMVYKMGRFGKFLACPNYPECRNTKAIVKKLEGIPCPKCGAGIIIRRTKKGRTFYGCEAYPDCDFISWDQPVKEKCPKCHSYMVLKRDRSGKKTHVCSNAECGYRETVPKGKDG